MLSKLNPANESWMPALSTSYVLAISGKYPNGTSFVPEYGAPNKSDNFPVTKYEFLTS